MAEIMSKMRNFTDEFSPSQINCDSFEMEGDSETDSKKGKCENVLTPVGSDESHIYCEESVDTQLYHDSG